MGAYSGHYSKCIRCIQCDQFLDDANCVSRQVGKEKEVADAEEKKVAKINEEVGKKQRDCERDLAKAEPALKAASEALNTLNKVSVHLCTYSSDGT